MAISTNQIQKLVSKDSVIHSLWAGSIPESYRLKLIYHHTPLMITGQLASGCICNTTRKFKQTSSRSGLLWIWRMIQQDKVFNSMFHKQISIMLYLWHLHFRIMLPNKLYDTFKKMLGKKWYLNNQIAKLERILLTKNLISYKYPLHLEQQEKKLRRFKFQSLIQILRAALFPGKIYICGKAKVYERHSRTISIECKHIF